MIDKIILSNLDLNDESKFNQYASQFTVDDLLDIFNRFKNDIQKKESVEKILRIKHSTLYKKAKTNEINLPEDICDKTKFRQRAFKYKLDDLLKWYSSVKDPEKKQAIESILRIKTYKENKNYSAETVDLDSVLYDFRDKEDGFIMYLREYNVDEDLLEYEFLNNLYKAINIILIGEEDKLQEATIDLMFTAYNINIQDKKLLRSLKHEIDATLGNSEINEPESIKKNENYEGSSHSVDNEESEGKDTDNLRRYDVDEDNTYGEDIIIYKIGDNFIPHDSFSCDQLLFMIINEGSESVLESMYKYFFEDDNLDEIKSDFKEFNDNYYKYIEYLKCKLLSVTNVDIIEMYNKGDRFEVVTPTYNIRINDNMLSCVDVRSKETGDIYTALSI